MKFLQIGLGSMGKRRIRNLKVLGFKDIIGYDLKEERRKECESKHGIKVVTSISEDILAGVDAVVISTSPDAHLEYMWLAVQHNIPAFIEASVIRNGLEKLNEAAQKKKALIAPSCTFRFHPSVKIIKDIVRKNSYGKVTNFIYHTGQYLPDWHPWENIKNFYVSKKEIGGCREIVPFELTWIVDVFDFPEQVFAFHGRTLDLKVNIDDVYSINMKFKGYFGNMVVDVVSRWANRWFILNLEKAHVVWNWNERVVKVYDALSKRWIHYYEPEGKAQEGYNVNIVEEMYIKELRAFLSAVEGKGSFPNTLSEDIQILELLEALEKTNKGVKVRDS